MPHLIIHCSNGITESISQQTITNAIFQTVEESGLFATSDIKIRIQSFDSYLVGKTKAPFIHVFAHIMQGRSECQRAQLSKSVVVKLSTIFPRVKKIAMNINEFEKRTYYNIEMLSLS